MDILTYALNDGRIVTAKEYEGDTYPITYANLTQAQKAVDKLGADWYVSGRRPFYATRKFGMKLNQSGSTFTDFLFVTLASVSILALVFTLGALPALIMFAQLATALQF